MHYFGEVAGMNRLEGSQENSRFDPRVDHFRVLVRLHRSGGYSRVSRTGLMASVVHLRFPVIPVPAII